MKLRDLAVEAWRNVRTGAARPLTALALAAVPTAGLIALEARAVNSAEHEATQFRDAMSAVYVLDTPNGISGAACDRLASIDGITRAGALRVTNQTITPATTPNAPIPLFEASKSFGHLIGADLTHGVAIEETIAHDYGLDAGSNWSTTRGHLAVGATYPFPPDGRNPQLQFAAVALTDRAVYDQCWAELWPVDNDKTVLLYSAMTAGAHTSQAHLVQLNPRNGDRLPARQHYATRPSASAPWLAAAWCALAVIGVSRIRRLELAFARHLGARPAHLGLQVLLETLAWALPASLLGSTVLLAFMRTAMLTNSAGAHGLGVLAAALAGTVIGAVTAGLINREQNLFRAFKKRT